MHAWYASASNLLPSWRSKKASGSSSRAGWVCALRWAAHDRELVSSHGYSHNQLALWKYPSMVRVAYLTGHTSRVLHMTQSPDGTTICTASGPPPSASNRRRGLCRGQRRPPLLPRGGARDRNLRPPSPFRRVADARLRFWKILSGSEQNKKERAAAKESVLSSQVRVSHPHPSPSPNPSPDKESVLSSQMAGIR